MDDQTWASIADLRARWIASTYQPDDAVIETFLEDASVIIDSAYPDLRDRAKQDTSGVVAARARLVCCRMVMRVLTNPDMLRSVQDTTGPFSGGVTYAAETLSGLYLSAEDRALLSERPASARGKAFEIDLLAGGAS